MSKKPGSPLPPKSPRASQDDKPAMTQEDRARILDNLAAAVGKKLRDAISARQASGIEQVWTQDEEFYQGIDDANRHEFAHITTKPTEGGRDVKLQKPKGSTLFPNITAPYVDAAAAKMADMLLPTDDRNFVVEPTPVPDLLDEEEGFEAAPPATGLLASERPAGMPLAPPQQAAPQQDPAAAMQPPPAPEAPQDEEAARWKRIYELLLKVEGVRLQAEEKAKKAQTQIDDYLTECDYHTELRQVIHDAARIGTGVLKGPMPKKVKTFAWVKNPQTGERELVVKIQTRPVSKRVDVWNLFPAPGCGDDIHRGSFLFERDFLTAKLLSQLKGGTDLSKHLDSVIDVVLEEGPKKNKVTGAARGTQTTELSGDEEFEVWRFYGEISADELEAAGVEHNEKDSKKRFSVLLTMVNDRVIKAAINPLDTGEFPFDVLPWKKRPGMPWGTGVSRQARVGQRMVTAATRNLMDNAGAASRPHKVVISELIEQGADPWTWRAVSDVQDVSKAMTFFVQPSLQEQLTAIIQLGERMVELHTGLPMIILGIQGDVEETAHGRALQNNNGSMVLRRLARQFDGSITQPHIRRYYTWMMGYSEDDSIKGDLTVKARGSAALVERDLQNQQLPMVMQFALQPAYELDPVLCAEEWLKSQRFDPKAFKLSEERKKELAALAARNPPPMPQVQAAQIREQGATQRLQMEQQFQAEQNELDRQVEKMVATIDAQLRSAELGSAERLALDDIKANLAGIVVKVRAQKEMSQSRELLKPPTEPKGRAAPGRSFEQ